MSDNNATLGRFYRWNAPIYNLTRWTILHGRRRAVDALQLEPGQCVLDLGCGTGLNFKHLYRRLGPSGRIVGLDLSAEMLTQARKAADDRVQLVQADAARFQLGQQFDAVLIAYALTMIPDWHGALERARAHLKPGGRLVILDFGRTRHPWAFWRHAFDRYLAMNHVDTDRDFTSALQPLVSKVEELHRPGAYSIRIRGTA